MKKIVLVFLFSTLLYSQTKPIQGRVADSNGNPLGNVNIVSKPSGAGTQSDDKGEFTFEMPVKDKEITFDHIGHNSFSVNAITFKNGTIITLEEKVLAMDSLDVTGTGRAQFDPFETKNSVIAMDTEALTVRGYTDIGDVLFSEQSLVMNENMNGQKSLSIRASTSEEMVYLYDGIRINTMGDPMLDLSLFSTSGFTGLELVKGSHEKGLASSGTINFIPKLTYGPSGAFHQQFGTYDYGGYDGFGSVGNPIAALNGGIGKGNFSQVYVGSDKPEINTTIQRQFAHLGIKNNHNLEVRLMGFQNQKKFTNDRTGNHVSLLMQNLIGKMIHSHPRRGFISFYGQVQNQTGNDSTVLASVTKHDLNQGGGFIFEKGIQNALLRFSSESTFLTSNWKFNDSTMVTNRKNSLITGSFEMIQPDNDQSIQLKDVKIVLSQQLVSDERDTNEILQITNKDWKETNALFTTSFLNRSFGKRILIYTNFGNVFRLPSLRERILNEIHSKKLGLFGLLPEHKSTYEMGIKLEKEPDENSGSYTMNISGFSYQYSNKIKQIHLTGVPVQFPITFGDATLSGIDSHLSLTSKRDWFKFTSSYSMYFFSDQKAFQLQPEKMVRNQLTMTVKWFRLDLIHRSESSRQISSIGPAGEYFTSQLNPIKAYDANFSFILDLWGLKTNLSFSGRNLNNEAQELNGISIYDRRYNLNFGVSWR